MMTANHKPWWRSRAIWGALVAGVAVLLDALGVAALAPEEQAVLVDALVAAGGVIGALVAVEGRVRAARPIRRRARGGPGAPPPPAAALALAAGLSTAALGGCASLDARADAVIGPADTVPQRVYRAAGVYGVAAGYVCAYLETPTAVPGVAARLVQADRAAYKAVTTARAAAAFAATPEDAGLPALGAALTAFAAEAAQESVSGAGADGGGPTLAYVLRRLAGLAAGAVHWRAELADVRADLAAQAAEGRPPAAAEWRTVMEAAAEAHACVQGRTA